MECNFYDTGSLARGTTLTKNMSTKKAAKLAKKVVGAKGVKKVIHPPYLKTNIPAGEAMPAPPLGPQLGVVGYGINV